MRDAWLCLRVVLIIACLQTEVKADRVKRIINGRVQFVPSVVRIEHRRRQFRCGGTLIAKNIVLTAAHCLQSGSSWRQTTYNPNELAVYVGSPFYGQHELTVPVRKIILHPNYASSVCRIGMAYKADIAILILGSMIPCSKRINISPLPLKTLRRNFDRYSTYNAEKDYRYCKVVGWGMTEKGRYSSNMRSAKVSILENQFCKKCAEYGSCFRDQGMVCAGDRSGLMRDACQGDSGGPLMCQPRNAGDRRWRLVGIVSWGSKCGKRLKPGVYTDVGHYVPWIMQTIQREHLDFSFWHAVYKCISTQT